MCRPFAIVLLAVAARAEFVGSKACAGCHAAQYRAQLKSEHARALAAAPQGSPGEWAFGAGDKAITYVSQADEDWYVEHGLSYYPGRKMLAASDPSGLPGSRCPQMEGGCKPENR
jgi:hypothetical protein